MPKVEATSIPIHGDVAPGFEEVRREFENNFAERGELGAACAVYREGEKVVDLGAAIAMPNAENRGSKIPWFSSTRSAKGSRRWPSRRHTARG